MTEKIPVEISNALKLKLAVAEKHIPAFLVYGTRRYIYDGGDSFLH